MVTKISFFGGVNKIGGNKILKKESGIRDPRCSSCSISGHPPSRRGLSSDAYNSWAASAA
ncbi:MAG: hypothetical protein AB1608_02310 [Thermoproteota archaeon]